LEGQVQTWKSRITLLELFHNAEGVQVVIKPLAEALHLPVQLFFTCMSERRVADIMAEGQPLRQILVQFQASSQSARYLSDFNGVSKASSKVVGQPWAEDLGLSLQTAECAGVDQPVAIALKDVAIWVFRFRVAPAPALLGRKPQVRQHAEARILKRAEARPRC